MTKKCFSLLSGKAIEIAPNTKIIPKEDFQKLLDGINLLEETQQDGEKYREEVAIQCEKLKEIAKAEGYQEGFNSWLNHIAKLEEEIINVRNEFKKMLVPLAMKAARKIVGRELEISEDAIVDIVANSLKTVATHKKITIYVSHKDIEILEKNKQKLKNLFEALEAFSLREKADLTSGSCVIETEGGIINAHLENQWQNLEKAFATLMKTKDMNVTIGQK